MSKPFSLELCYGPIVKRKAELLQLAKFHGGTACIIMSLLPAFLHTISPHSSRSATQGLHQDPTKWPNVGPWPWLKKNIRMAYGDPYGWTMEAGAGSHHVIILVPETLALQISNTSLLLSVADSLGLVTCQSQDLGLVRWRSWLQSCAIWQFWTTLEAWYYVCILCML